MHALFVFCFEELKRKLVFLLILIVKMSCFACQLFLLELGDLGVSHSNIDCPIEFIHRSWNSLRYCKHLVHAALCYFCPFCLMLNLTDSVGHGLCNDVIASNNH